LFEQPSGGFLFFGMAVPPRDCYAVIVGLIGWLGKTNGVGILMGPDPLPKKYGA